MTRTNCFYVLLVGFLGIVGANVELSAQEFAVVTGDNGYIVNSKNEVQYKVPSYTLIEFEDVRDNKLILSRESVDRGIRLGQVFVILELSEKNGQLSSNNKQLFKDAFVGLRDAFKRAAEEKYKEAIKIGKQAATKLEILFLGNDEPSPYEVWFQSHIAYFEFMSGERDAANKRLDDAEAKLTRMKVKDPVQAADLYNVRGLIRLDEGKQQEAISLFKKSRVITEKTFGKNHINQAVFYINMSFAYQELGQSQSALDAQNEAMKLMLDIFPSEAVELPIGYSRLGDLYFANKKPRQAIKAYDFALRNFLNVQQLKHPVEMANTRLGLSDAIASLKEFELAQKTLKSGLDIEVMAMNGKDEMEFKRAYLYRIGLINYDQEKFDESLKYFQKARKLYVRINEVSVDAMILEAIGHIEAYNNNSTKAKEFYKQALQIYTRVEGKDSSNVSDVKQWISDLG